MKAFFHKLLMYFTRGSRARRIEAVREAIIGTSEPAEPHVVGGVYYWQNTPGGPVAIDIFFPDQPLAIIVGDFRYAPSSESSTVIDRQAWKKAVAHTSYNVRMCRSAGIPTVFIAPNDPIDPDSLALAIQDALIIRHRTDI